MKLIKSNNVKRIYFVLLFFVVLLSIGFSGFNTSAIIKGIAAGVRVEVDIRITGVSTYEATSDGISNYEDYNVSSINGEVYLPNSDSSVTYKVSITNFESTIMGIFDITGLPDNLEYTISESSNYNLKDKLCDDNGKCNLGMTKDLYITIKYKDGMYNSENISYNFNLIFDFRIYHSVTYENLYGAYFPDGVINGGDLTIDLEDDDVNLIITDSSGSTNIDYEYKDGVLNISNVTKDLNIKVDSNVVITNVSYDGDSAEVIKYYGTKLNSEVTLSKTDASSTVTFEIDLYNNSDTEHIFIGALTNKTNNTNIEYSISGIEEYSTVIGANDSKSFTITFKYVDGADITQNTLLSTIDFRFKEVPKLVLSNENKTYTLSDIYPNYTPSEYEFTVSNYNDNEINKVPMNYYFEVDIDSPLTVKIYDENGNEVTSNISIDGNGTDKIEHTYTLKVIWDDSNPTSGISYNSSSYASKEFNCNISLIAVPTDAEYLEYQIAKEFNIDITSASLNLNATAENVKVEKTSSDLKVTINNYSSSTSYNVFDVEYEISVVDNDKFTASITGESSSNGVFTRTISGNELISDNFTIKLAADINNLSVTETATLKIVIKSPYEKEITVPLTIKLQPVTVTLNANGGSVSSSSITVYKGKTYSNLPTPTWTGHTFNGWYTAKSGGTKISSTTEVTTSSSTQTLYAQWTSHLLVDYVTIGDYVNYPVYYDNVGTNGDGGYIADDEYTGWRVLSIEGSGDNRYVRLITAGVPMTYRHPYTTTYSSYATTSVKNLTTNFFSTAIKTTATNNYFHRCGFKTSSTATSSVTTISAVQDLFENNYTQTSSGVPVVKSITKTDLDNAIAEMLNVTSYTTTNGEYLTTTLKNYDYDLFAIPSTTSGSYAAYYLADVAESYYLWNVRYVGAVIYTYYEYGVRPVVSLNIGTLTSGQVSGVWQLKS